MGSRKNTSPKKPSPSTSPTRFSRRRRVATEPHAMSLRQRIRPISPIPHDQNTSSGTTNTIHSKTPAPMIYQDASLAGASFMSGPLTPQPPTPTPMIDQDQITIFQLEVQRVEARSRATTPVFFQDVDVTGGTAMAPEPPIPMSDQDAVTGLQLEVERFEARSDAVSTPLTPEPPVPMTDQDAVIGFQLEVERFKARSDAVIAEQERALELIKEKEAVLQEQYKSVQKKHEEDLAARKKIHECPLCSDLAWDSHVLACGHSFCVRCLNRHRSEHVRMRQEYPQTSDVLIRCPTCGSSILTKPMRSVVLQNGVNNLAAELLVMIPPTEPLQWSY
ncbi:hypothetical protein C8R42DRAFT_729794 [Lentinula raphanica]|nr:hypothetical protein C8R42DRAFT_729794 [Lentinula raphanica]